jgi:hypothetical protein
MSIVSYSAASLATAIEDPATFIKAQFDLFATEHYELSKREKKAMDMVCDWIAKMQEFNFQEDDIADILSEEFNYNTEECPTHKAMYETYKLFGLLYCRENGFDYWMQTYVGEELELEDHNYLELEQCLKEFLKEEVMKPYYDQMFEVFGPADEEEF